MKSLVLCVAAFLTACNAKPRAVSYFVAHPEIAANVEAACKRGTHRGAECDNAAGAISTLKRSARMANYKRAFE